MDIKQVKRALQNNFVEMTKDSSYLFEVELDKDELWNLYLDSFPLGTNEIYRERREHDCSACRQFIKNIGNVVTIKDNEVKTMWDFESGSSEYQPVIDALAAFVKSQVVSSVKVNKFSKIGIDKNYEQSEGKINEYEHFYLELPARFVNSSGKSEGDLKGDYQATRDVFKRSLEEITKDSILTIFELINSNTLYKGEEWKGALSEFLRYKLEYDLLNTEEEKNIFVWEQSVKAGIAVGRIRNHSIGTLLVNVSEGLDLDEAVRKYESIVAPENYRRPKAIFTKKMLEDAKNEIEKLGLTESLPRRFAILDDITANNVLFSNRDSVKRMIGNQNVFDEMSTDVAVNPKKFSRIEEIPIVDFVENVLPTTNELEVLFENRHSKSMVSLIAPVNGNAPSMFKWNNPFSWAYSGNITDSSMKENVKNAGGNVEGVLRFSIQWNDNEYDQNDLDAHCFEPNGNEIHFRNMRSVRTTGVLDVDIINPVKGKPAVENITWTDKNRMLNGVYKFFVHQFSNRGGRTGFKAEIEFDGQIYSFEYGKELRQGEIVHVAEVTLNNGVFSIKEVLPSNVSTKEVWNLKTNQFVPVSVVCYSPNYWDLQDNIGHRHYMFMLKDCINPEQPNGFFNEYLKNELEINKRVFEALGSKMRVQDTPDQLSGIGFSATKRNEVIVKVTGQTERIMKVKF